MRKAVVLIVIGLLIAPLVYAQEKPTRLYTPIIKQATYDGTQSSTTIWTPTTYDSVVCNGYIISTQDAQEVTLKASDTIVTLNVLASSPTVSPAGFLFKGIALETILIDSDLGGVSVTLTGWEEDN